MEGSSSDYDEPFEVSDSIESVSPSADNEGANVSRVAALSTMLGDNRAAVRDLRDEVVALGFPPSLASGDFAWGDLDWVALIQGADAQPEPEEARVRSWETLRETGEPSAAVSFVVAMLGSELERESAGAAAVLWRNAGQVAIPAGLRPPSPWLWEVWEDIYELGGPEWPAYLWWGGVGDGPYGTDEPAERDIVPWEPDRWSRLYSRAISRFGGRYDKVAAINLLVRWRLVQALRSPDPVTRSLATAAFLGRAEQPVGPAESTRLLGGGEQRSTMIHGTFGWKGNWWRPRPGSFHDFVLNQYRANLYRGGARFSWSGAYSARQRGLAASDFSDWEAEIAPAGLQSVFAHSYGGEVAARAKIAGAAVDQIVLLSSPVNAYIDAIATDPTLSIVDVRLNFDPVLAIAQVRQRIRPLPATVAEVVFAAWRLDHGATHKERVWNAENVAIRGGI